jgi:hypothetical protein
MAPPPYTDAFFTASTAIAITLLAVLVVLRAELRWKAPVLAAAMLPVFASPFVDGYTPARGLLDVLLLTLVATVAGAAIRPPPRAASRRRVWPLDDAIVFGLAVGIAALVSDQVLERYTVSGDEWADVYQADLFAHLRSYGAPRACPAVFRNWWVFEKAGRTFAQYTPGWPLLMAPFQRAGAVWLAGPFTFGVVAVGVARLARRVAGTSAPRIAGIVAPLFLAASPSALLNGASLYPHTMVCACFAWTVESLFAMSDASTRRDTIGWGVVLGSAGTLMVATRPMDGVVLLAGVGAVILLTRAPLPRAGVVAAGAAAAFWGALVLVILHAQLGVWFATAYAMSPIALHFSAPKLHELAYAIPFDRATPYWWPCALPIVPFGVFLARGRGRVVTWSVTLGATLLVVAYAWLDAGRDGAESGYGSRFHLPLLVPMNIASGVLFAWLIERVRSARGPRRWTDALATAAVVLTAVEVAFVVAPTVYPAWHATLHRDHALRRAIAESGIHHAVVVVHQAELAQEVWDLTQNLPSEPDPDVLVLTDWHAEDDFACARQVYAGRSWFIARGHERVVLSGYDPRVGQDH